MHIRTQGKGGIVEIMDKKKSYTSSFARIYDDIMDAVPYDLWEKYIEELLNYYNKKPQEILDLACGTGNMTIRFARKYKRVTGVDFSSDMLEIARKKAETLNNINFINEDMRNFKAKKNYDLALSLFDSLNYILKFEELKKIFHNVYQALKPEGLFIFDMNTPYRLMSIKPGTNVFNGDYYTCFWEDNIDKDRGKWQVKLKIYFEDRSEYYQEIHEETAYPYKKIVKGLKDTGFATVDVYRAYTFLQGDDKANRLYYVANKNKKSRHNKRAIKRFKKIVRWRLKKYFSRLILI
ncbi:MAG: class I SAM-dependent DNA methyltransferase [Halanaerobiales bacterium]